jgi:hypothetical protein
MPRQLIPQLHSIIVRTYADKSNFQIDDYQIFVCMDLFKLWDGNDTLKRKRFAVLSRLHYVAILFCLCTLE